MMNSDLTGQQTLDAVAAYLTALLTGLFERLAGSWVARPVFGNVTWADLGAVLCLVLLVLLINGVLAGWLRRRARKHEAAEGAQAWRKRVFEVIGKPLYLLLWVYGVYFALVPLLLKMQPVEDESTPFLLNVAQKLFDCGVFAALFWLFFRLTRVLEMRLAWWAGKSGSRIDDLIMPLLGKTLRVLVPIIVIILALPLIGLPPAYDFVIGKISSLLVIGVIAWILFQGVGLIERIVLAKYDIKAADNLEARKIYTQVKVLNKTLYVVITIFTVASMLMLFEEVRRFGTSILASAGVVGIIIGFAAQRTIANLFAGFQLAMTQPIRIDDVVIVEGEWGRVEEITLTYVVIKIWDQRRLVVPLSYFIEKPFQNWTRVSSDILGSVFVYADYTLPVEEIRQEVKRLVENHPKWDGKFWNVQITDATDRAMQVRVLVTASDSGKAWDMRCDIREQLIAFIQSRHPQALPKVRGELGGSLQQRPVPAPN